MLTTRIFALAALLLAMPVFGQVGNLSLSHDKMFFNINAGSTVPVVQILGVTSTGTQMPFSTSVRYLSPTEGWLTAIADSASTPSNVTVRVDPTGLVAGTYIGQVLVVSSGSQSGLVTVTLTIGGDTGPIDSITASPTSVQLSSNSQTGQAMERSVTLSSQFGISFQVFLTTASGGSWLSVDAPELVSPTTITIRANPAGLPQGIYTGTVSISPQNGSQSIAIPVTFTVDGAGGVGGFTVTPDSLNFLYQTGTANPVPQSVFVSNSSGQTNYVATSNVEWARLSSNTQTSPAPSVSGTSGANLTVHVNPTGLTPGTYSGTVILTSSGGLSRSIAISLLISGNALLTASPNSLLFTYYPDIGFPDAQQLLIASTGSAISFNAGASSVGGWLGAGPQGGNTQSNNLVNVSVNPAGLGPGSYTGVVEVSGNGTILTIPVTLLVAAANTDTIKANPGILNFNAQVGSPASTQSFTLNAPSTKQFQVSAAAIGSSWISVSPSSGSTPATITVTATPQMAGGAGNYTGNIQVNNLTDGTQFAFPVTLKLSGGALTVAPSTLNFSLQAGSSGSAAQALTVSGTPGAALTASSSQFWLTVSPLTGSIGSAVTVSVSAASLSVGTYSGVVTLVSSGATANIAVTLTVTESEAPLLTPSNLTFQYTPGQGQPTAQSIAVDHAAGATGFSYTTNTLSGGNWLNVSASGGTTPATFTVSVAPSGLAPGTYRGRITVAANGKPDTRTAEVTLTVTPPVVPTLQSAFHGASRERTSVAPGMIISLFGNSMGPLAGATGRVGADGKFETSYDGYRVLFDGQAAPILYIAANRIDTVVPYRVAGSLATRVAVENVTGRSSELELRVTPDATPAIFSLDTSGKGPAAALNQDATLNTPSNAVPANGGILVFWVTGEGVLVPDAIDGKVIGTDLRRPVLPVSVNIGGVPVEVLYAGSAPEAITGLMQVNVRLNSGVPTGGAVPLEIRVGPAPSPTGITVSVR